MKSVELKKPKVKAFMLSTSDNPFNPFTDFDNWFAFDEGKGYHTCQYLARISEINDELGEVEKTLSNNLAIEQILQFNLTGNYIKVPEPD